ncbi:CRE-KLP-11 protein [Caenorhabditis remanei]|uniref:CRE-KLP-11 protein n=1 Tax=Caenorhabditis remanei TaxID=31234 RepID=E3NGI8_CAERE|nr:CRE-KLP-11 protein [Caenorhabditis remanei]
MDIELVEIYILVYFSAHNIHFDASNIEFQASYAPARFGPLTSNRQMSSTILTGNRQWTFEVRIVHMRPQRGQIELKNPKEQDEPTKDFTFDAIYDENSTQSDLYEETFRDLVDSVLSGYNATIFAYGQTGTGKTHTMEGKTHDPEQRGVIYKCIDHIFDHITASHNQEYLVRASYLEIYQEELRDLLEAENSKKLEIKERPDGGVYVKDLTVGVPEDPKLRIYCFRVF